MISEERLEAAMKFLADTDEIVAELKAQLARKEYLCKLARAKVFLTSEGSVESRKATAETSTEVMQAEGFMCDAIADYEKCKGKRARAELVCEIWRSLEASRRQGV